MVGKTRELEKTDMIFFLRKFCSLNCYNVQYIYTKKMFVNRNASTYPKSAPDVPTHHTINLLKH